MIAEAVNLLGLAGLTFGILQANRRAVAAERKATRAENIIVGSVDLDKLPSEREKAYREALKKIVLMEYTNHRYLDSVSEKDYLKLKIIARDVLIGDVEVPK